MSRLVIVGAGPVGVAAADGAIEDGAVDSVIAVVDPEPSARQAAAARFDAAALEKVSQLPEPAEGDWALVAFSSRAEDVAPAILRLVSDRYHVVTTCEELSRPDVHVLQAIRTAAVTEGRRVMATGANPGFIMDRLALAVAGGSRRIRRIDIRRRLDTAQRRDTLISKTGRGLDVAAFEAGVAAGQLGHVGLVASAKLVARGLLWPTHDVSETIEPVVGDDGLVRGIHQTATLRTQVGGVIDLDLVMAWGEVSADAVYVHGSPDIRVEVPGGYHGDLGTTAQVVNAIGRYNGVPPGFYRSIDLPLRFS